MACLLKCPIQLSFNWHLKKATTFKIRPFLRQPSCKFWHNFKLYVVAFQANTNFLIFAVPCLLRIITKKEGRTGSGNAVLTYFWEFSCLCSFSLESPFLGGETLPLEKSLYEGRGQKMLSLDIPLLSNACWLLTCRSVEVNSIWNMWLEGSMNWKYVYGAIAISLKAQFMFSVEGVARQIHWTAAKCALVRLRIKSSWWMMHTVVIFQNNENNQRQQDMIHGKL